MSVCLPFPDTRVQTSAVTDTVKRTFGPWVRALSRTFTERDRRRRLARLLDYDDRMLDDMGVTRFDIEEALKLPLSVNAIAALHGEAAAVDGTGGSGVA